MSGVETRHIQRDSLFLTAEVRLDGEEAAERVKVRNLSARGMMAEGSMSVLRGARVSINLRNIGWIEGSVAWVHDNRFGIAFAKEVDPKLARTQIGGGEISTPRFTRPSSLQPTLAAPVDPERLRKI